jgi:hypothetical protein
MPGKFDTASLFLILTGLAAALAVLGLSLAATVFDTLKLGTSTELCCWQKQCSLAQPRGVRGTWPASAWG